MTATTGRSFRSNPMRAPCTRTCFCLRCTPLVLDEPSEHWQADGSGIDPGRFSGRERLWIVRIGTKAVVKRDRANDRFDVTRVGQASAT
jgi:hypothetical protein